MKTADDNSTVVFHILPAMPYRLRLVISFAGILIGLGIQLFMLFELPGILLVLAGNLLLLPRGYDNRVDLGRYQPDSDWVKAERSKLQEVKELDRKMKKWDRAAIDITNPLGFALFAICAGCVAVMIWFGFAFGFVSLRLLGFNIVVLFVPHWFTGTRSICTRPDLILKISLIEKIIDRSASLLNDYTVDYFLRLAGSHVKIPEDVKFRVSAPDQDSGFLGFYCQVVTNKVQGTSYPYFYVVLVAKKGFGLDTFSAGWSPPESMTREFNVQDDVELLVLRQTTTKKTGYHTNPAAANAIFTTGLNLFTSTLSKN